MNFKTRTRTQNLHIDENKEFSKKIKVVDSTYTNRMISNVRINIPDLEVPWEKRMNIDHYSLVEPLSCKISRNYTPKMRRIKIPEYKEYEYHITPFNDYTPFVGVDSKRPFGELHYRSKALTSREDFPKIDIQVDDKLNMKKW